MIEIGSPKAPKQIKVYGSGLGKPLAEIELQGLKLASKNSESLLSFICQVQAINEVSAEHAEHL